MVARAAVRLHVDGLWDLLNLFFSRALFGLYMSSLRAIDVGGIEDRGEVGESLCSYIALICVLVTGHKAEPTPLSNPRPEASARMIAALAR